MWVKAMVLNPHSLRRARGSKIVYHLAPRALTHPDRMAFRLDWNLFVAIPTPS